MDFYHRNWEEFAEPELVDHINHAHRTRIALDDRLGKRPHVSGILFQNKYRYTNRRGFGRGIDGTLDGRADKMQPSFGCTHNGRRLSPMIMDSGMPSSRAPIPKADPPPGWDSSEGCSPDGFPLSYCTDDLKRIFCALWGCRLGAYCQRPHGHVIRLWLYRHGRRIAGPLSHGGAEREVPLWACPASDPCRRSAASAPS